MQNNNKTSCVNLLFPFFNIYVKQSMSGQSLAKCEEENGQTIIIQGIGIAMKTCVVFNIIVKKIKLKHPNLTSQILPECISKSGRICSFY
jgi:hypothetical protein